MGWKRIEIQLIPSSWILPFLSPFMFFVELKTKAVKIKKRKCFLNSNDFENKTNATPALIVTQRKEKKISLSKTFYSHDHTMEAIILFIIVTSTWCKYQTEILNNAWNCYFRFTLQLLACLASPEATPPPYIVGAEVPEIFYHKKGFMGKKEVVNSMYYALRVVTEGTVFSSSMNLSKN